ncbi:MAG: hypothetical protein U9N50_07780 [Pseudomonadota bacterium]|nr:hypothetical protein [Pseudomonadota bacterium]
MLKALFFSMLMLLAASASASGIAKFKGMDGGKPYILSLEYLDQKTSRIDMDSESDTTGYLLFNNRQAQVVSSYQGNTLVMDLASMNQMAQSLGVMKMLGIDSETLLVHVISMKATGKKETVAGISGEIYNIIWSRNNVKQQDELVLSRSQLAWDYTAAWIDAIDVVSKASPSIKIKGDELMSKVKKDKLGILRFGNRFQLVSARSMAINPARFVAPDTSFNIPGLTDLLGNL